MKELSEIITLMIEAYGSRSDWMRVCEVADRTGLTADELARGIEHLMEDPDFRAEPTPWNGRAHGVANADTAINRAFSPRIGGEWRDLIRWY